QSEEPEQLELHRPRKQENRLHIEHHEQDGDNVETNSVAATRVVKRRDAALVRHQLDVVRFSRPDQGEKRQRPCGYEEGDQRKNENRYVILRHRELPLLSL